MRINPTGYAERSDRIMAIVADEVFNTVFDEVDLQYQFNAWAYRHEDGSYTMHWSYNGIGDAGMTEVILVENPMTAFANSRPIIDKVKKAVADSGIV